MDKLDLKDRKLLYELDGNSRQSIQKLAKKLSLSKDAVSYRINKLLKSGIIKSFNAVVDSGKLGYYSFRIFLKFYGISPEKEKEIMTFLLKNKNLVWVVQVEGNWDINTWFLYKSIDEMNLFWQELITKYNNYLEKKEFGIYSEINYFGREFLIENKLNKLSIPIVSLPKKIKLDEKDLLIVNLLANNARTPIIEIANKVKITPKTAINKIRRLEKERVIVGYRTEFSLEKLGYKYYKIHLSMFNTTAEKIKRLKQEIKQNPNIIFEDIVLGGYDFEFEVQIENEDKLRELLENIRVEFSDIIKDYEIMHYYKEYRLRFFPDVLATK
jgi:DNA-binding Lrp family transcriptional regulator